MILTNVSAACTACFVTSWTSSLTRRSAALIAIESQSTAKKITSQLVGVWLRHSAKAPHHPSSSLVIPRLLSWFPMVSLQEFGHQNTPKSDRGSSIRPFVPNLIFAPLRYGHNEGKLSKKNLPDPPRSLENFGKSEKILDIRNILGGWLPGHMQKTEN